MIVHWMQLDPWNRPTGAKFEGTFPELQKHLMGLLPGVRCHVTMKVDILLLRVEPHLHQRMRTSVALHETPWGNHRWIPRPRGHG